MFCIKKEWYEAIGVRRSKRDYLTKLIETEKIELLNKLAEDINKTTEGIRIVLVNQSSEGIFKGMVGSYGKISDTPAYALFIGNTEDKNVEEKIGYYGESYILELTRLGLGSCWVGGTYDPKVAGKAIELASNEKIYSVTPVGYPKAEVKISERLLKIIVKSDKRKKLSEICEDSVKKVLPEWVQISLEAGRAAPSAINRQPWYFYADEKSIKVAVDKEDRGHNYSRRLDCGIAMLHIEVGALTKGITGKWKYLESPLVAEFIVD